jgi:5'-3' exonuclease
MLILVDMNNLAHRVFHTPQGILTTKQGEPSGVLLGVLNSLKGMLDKFPEADDIIACWDGGRSEWRKSLYPDYKAQRDYGKQDEEKAEAYRGLWKQMNELHNILHLFNIKSIKVDGQEADDLIAGFCAMAEGEKIIVSSDKDLLQLISEDVSVAKPLRGGEFKMIGISDFYTETGVTKEAYIGYRALVGDSSDNISGVPGIGEKTAKNLMDKYGHIDNILNAQGEDKKALMKSARTKKIFDTENLKVLGRNNKIMSFKFAQYDEMEKHIQECLVKPYGYDQKEVKAWLMRWQFVSILANYISWIIPFRGLEYVSKD